MKKTLSFILAVILIIISAPVFSALTTDDKLFIYTVNNDNTVTIKFNSTPQNNALTKITIPSQINGMDVTVIGASAFYKKQIIEEITIPDTVKTIDDLAFYGCSKLKSVNMGAGVETLGTNAFSSCTSLTSINISSVNSVGERAFFNCGKLSSIVFGNGLTEISKNAFTSCKALTGITFPGSLKKIDDYAFNYCSSIDVLVFPDSLEYIGNSAFKNNTLLTSVTFGNGKLEIGGYAFENCPELTSVTIPSNVSKIGRNAFSNRDETVVTYGTSITCTSHSAGFAYAFGSNTNPFVTDFNKTMEPGNIDGRKGVTTEDARTALRAAAGIIILNKEESALSDVNGNNMTDSQDALYILQRALGIYSA